MTGFYWCFSFSTATEPSLQQHTFSTSSSLIPSNQTSKAWYILKDVFSLCLYQGSPVFMLDVISLLHFHPLHLRLGCTDFTDFAREISLYIHTSFNIIPEFSTSSAMSSLLLTEEKTKSLHLSGCQQSHPACELHRFLTYLRDSSEQSTVKYFDECGDYTKSYFLEH